MYFAQVSTLLVTLLTQCVIPWVLSEHLECSIMVKVAQLQEECHRTLARDNQSLKTGCNGMWDNITCWPPARVGEVVVVPCPHFPGFFLDIKANVSRTCTSAGWTDLSLSYFLACGYNNKTPPTAKFYRVVKTIYTVGHSLSLFSLTVAIVILCIFSKLHCTRNYIHMHLFMSFILRAISVFIKDLVLFEGGESNHCSKVSAGCKAAMVFFQYCIMANFSWLLVEGLYLHTLLVISLFSEKKYFWWYILIGWGSPLLFIIAWTLARLHLDNVGCWQNIDSSVWWIIRGPNLVFILVNFVLFTCIIRILIQKLHSPDVGLNKSSQQYTRLAKSTLLLIPLFGINYIVFVFFPDNFNPNVKMVFDLVIGSFQGFIVAVLYCFLNGESIQMHHGLVQQQLCPRTQETAELWTQLSTSRKPASPLWTLSTLLPQ
ncbi:vasoactive intestinal polypeptide receptor-like isoform X2 [Pristis pectinata]|uniref:vasoactive intestinal polypeptide receptor-like isoform X2 n=1 Tax=Pristis pectinata TaxID=685728 RepID=UPI00223E662E|nr:vasoactive intestinal polypeptide receptor-like isoform X2 [Pristis pectinata]